MIIYCLLIIILYILYKYILIMAIFIVKFALQTKKIKRILVSSECLNIPTIKIKLQFNAS